MEKWVWIAKQASKSTQLFIVIFGISQPLWGWECQNNLPASLDTPKETFKGKCDSISRGAQLHKKRGVAEPQLFWFTSRLSQSSELCYLKRMVQTQNHQEHTVIFTICFTWTVMTKEEMRRKRRQGGLTRVRPEVSCEGVPPSAGIAAEGTFERFLPRVQLDVPQQVPLLGKRSSTLVTVEGAFTWKENGRERTVKKLQKRHGAHYPALSNSAILHRYSPHNHTALAKVRGCFFCTMGRASSSDSRLFP